MRAKIDKRNRKLVDYDATRHTIEQLKTSKKRDDQKLVSMTSTVPSDGVARDIWGE